MIRGVALFSLAAGLLVVAGAARADTLYQTGFESPTFAAGAINGQDGWSGNGMIQAGTVKSGSQALFTDGTISNPLVPGFGFGSGDHAAGYSTAGRIFTFSVDFLSSGSAVQSGLSIYGNAGFLGQSGQYGGALGNGTTFLGNFNSGNLGADQDLGVWHHLILSINFINGIMSSTIDGQTVPSVPIVNASSQTSITDVQLFSFGQLGFPQSPGGAYFDNLNITVTPLPSAAIAGMGGLAGVAGIGLIRRRRTI
jgi:hypothetical protein